MPQPRAVVLMPTFNEIESLARTLDELIFAVPGVDVLVIDDNSPDGTGALADELATADERIRVLHREAKRGLGAAYLAGMRWALREGYDLIIEMDADGSHPAQTLPDMLAAARDADLVIGSRYVAGGGTDGWAEDRARLSRAANAYGRVAMGISVHDMTAGFRVFRADFLRGIDLRRVTSAGYCFQIDMTRIVADAGARIVEVPIVFRERKAGASKMGGAIVTEALVKVTGWGIGRRAAQLRHALRRFGI
ncbi:polyprenol monophosphomannose synthase [uncultured Agrococcus sp.]|uniref:polyprenol monophosphomannose synthase n=1 Tax=uncultured Agrococcus sp. TaxID=382258 RepID=UPI0025DC3A07|nr:polyprenol monophosphomannose synthase [uncultured Agrococcus sp.]